MAARSGPDAQCARARTAARARRRAARHEALSAGRGRPLRRPAPLRRLACAACRPRLPGWNAARASVAPEPLRSALCCASPTVALSRHSDRIDMHIQRVHPLQGHDNAVPGPGVFIAPRASASRPSLHCDEQAMGLSIALTRRNCCIRTIEQGTAQFNRVSICLIPRLFQLKNLRCLLFGSRRSRNRFSCRIPKIRSDGNCQFAVLCCSLFCHAKELTRSTETHVLFLRGNTAMPS